jgi:hypothetical protein
MADDQSAAILTIARSVAAWYDSPGAGIAGSLPDLSRR